MASIVLRQVYLALVSDLANPVVGYSTGFHPHLLTSIAGGSDTRTGRGQVRVYANGRARNVTAAGITRAYQMNLELLTFAQVQTVEGWLNQTVLYRDSLGRKAYGVVNQVQVGDFKGVDGHEVGLTVTETSYSEAV